MNLSKLTSRKLAVTVATVGGLIAAKAYAEAAGVAVAYLIAQGVLDGQEAKKAASVLGTLDEVVDAVRKELSAVDVPEKGLSFPASAWEGDGFSRGRDFAGWGG